jgi:uncharacterized protein with NRDE domain
MDFWDTPPDILAGKDLEQGGTWFGVHKNGTFAALTNYRDPSSIRSEAPSRGEIIVDFLSSGKPPEPYFNKFTRRAAAYNGFNLLFGNKSTLFWYSNLKNEIQPIPPGIHGLSNRFLNTPWPKVASGKKALENLVRDTVTLDGLFKILADQSVPHDHQLPQTGVTHEWERILSPIFIQSDAYGTRSSTVMLMDQGGSLTVAERTYSLKNKEIFTDRHFFIPA